MTAQENIVDRPIFIIGTGRSGTTLLFHLLAKHPALAWPCQYMLGRPLRRRVRAARKLASWPVVGRCIDPVWYQRNPAHEPYEFWRKYYYGFSRPCRDLTADDVPRSMPDKVRRAFADQVAAMGRDRFLTKYTGWSRIRFIDTMFPEALYVNVVRDGRAVAWSLMNVDWWLGWQGPSNWRWGELSRADREIWDRSGRSFFVLAGIAWKILMDNAQTQGETIGQRYLPVRYEELVAAPEATIGKILHFAGLSRSDAFLETVRETPIRDSNHKWQQDVAPREKVLFNDLLGDSLARHGYGPAAADVPAVAEFQESSGR